jgi:hypothetical protein
MVSPGQRVFGKRYDSRSAELHGPFLFGCAFHFESRHTNSRRVNPKEKRRTPAKGDILAETGGTFSRVVRVPVDCQITEINAGGVVIMVTRGESVMIKAGCQALLRICRVIMGVDHRIGAEALVQGVWGNIRQTG